MLVGYNFLDSVRLALARAREEAMRLGHPYVGAEHILLGLLDTATGVTARVLQPVDIARLRSGIEQRVHAGNGEPQSAGDLPYTSRAKRVLELAMHEARELRSDAVGTEHLLLGLLRDGRGIAAAMLTEAGLRLEGVRATITERAAGEKVQPKSPLHRLLVWIAHRIGMSRGG
jgi:ATP-dependent Clp protease ATP-binding subunit ClpC